MKIKYRLCSISNSLLFCYLLLILVACNSTSNKVEFKRATELYESRKDTLEKPYFHRRIVDSLLKDKTKKEMLLELVKRFKEADLDLIHEIDEGDFLIQVLRYELESTLRMRRIMPLFIRISKGIQI